VIVGASFDSVEDQKKFSDAEQFPYQLISDESKEIGKAYQAERTPDMDYYEAGIPQRISYLINPEGVIAKAYDFGAGGLDLAEHASAVLADIADLS